MQTRTGRELTGRTVLVCLLAFFAIVIGVNAVMVKLAIDTLPGTEVESTYRASLAYNREIDAARAQADRGWHVVAHVERAQDGHAAIEVEARDRLGAPVSGAAVTARLARPTDRQADREAVLSEREAGFYRASLDGVAKGQWDLIIEADRGAERQFLSRNRVVLK